MNNAQKQQKKAFKKKQKDILRALEDFVIHQQALKGASLIS
jgi:hypothetical protein